MCIIDFIGGDRHFDENDLPPPHIRALARFSSLIGPRASRSFSPTVCVTCVPLRAGVCCAKSIACASSRKMPFPVRRFPSKWARANFHDGGNAWNCEMRKLLSSHGGNFFSSGSGIFFSLLLAKQSELARGVCVGVRHTYHIKSARRRWLDDDKCRGSGRRRRA